MTLLEIKAEIFDLIRKQEDLMRQFKQLDKVRRGKIDELTKAENKQDSEVS